MITYSMLYSLQPFYTSLSHFNSFLYLSSKSVPRDALFYFKRYQKATIVSKDSGHSLGGRMNAERAECSSWEPSQTSSLHK